MSRSVLVPARGRAVGIAIGVLAVWFAPALARQARGPVSIAAGSLTELRQWDQRIDSMRRAGELRTRYVREDNLLPGRTHERFDQYHRGVRVFGADVARQLEGGQIVSVFGNLRDDITIDTTPVVDADRARAIVAARAGVELGPSRQPELVVLPLDGGYALAWRLRAASDSDIRQYFVDARTGAVVREYSELKTQSAVGNARGVLGDRKKISVEPNAGRFLARDGLRPPQLTTYDMQGNLSRMVAILNGVASPSVNDIASDTDNDWTDGAISDAHVYTGWTYDYFFKRHNRRGLDGTDIPIRSFTHPVRRSDIFTASNNVIGTFFLNAFYAGEGIMVYGVGLPAGFFTVPSNQYWDFTSGALDIVAHELTHGVTDYTSALIYENESGALNEAFSDIMATSIEFFFRESGGGSQEADYLIGEDVVRPGGIRSMSNPASLGDPDHYSLRFTGPEDNGGVHINSAIPNQAFHLAIEGGTNRTSGMIVQGVGGGNREQIERVFYRAFTQMLPAGATFSVARAATIQASRDLFGNNSAAERAISQAWSAVGVN